MTEQRDPSEDVKEASMLDVLMKPRELTETLLFPYFSNGRKVSIKKEKILEALATQAALGRRLRNKSWLKTMRYEAFYVFGASREWVIKHFGSAPRAYARPLDKPWPVEPEEENESSTIQNQPKESPKVLGNLQAGNPSPKVLENFRGPYLYSQVVKGLPSSTSTGSKEEISSRTRQPIEKELPSRSMATASTPPFLMEKEFTSRSMVTTSPPRPLMEKEFPSRSTGTTSRPCPLMEEFPSTASTSHTMMDREQLRTGRHMDSPNPRVTELQYRNPSSSEEASPKRSWSSQDKNQAHLSKRPRLDESALSVTRTISGKVVSISTKPRTDPIFSMTFVNSERKSRKRSVSGEDSNRQRGQDPSREASSRSKLRPVEQVQQSSRSSGGHIRTVEFHSRSHPAQEREWHLRPNAPPTPSPRERERHLRSNALPPPSSREQERGDLGSKPEKTGRRSVCDIAGCGMTTTFPKLHLIEQHLPAVFSEKIILSDEVTQRRYACLVSIAKCLLGSTATLHNLVDHVNSHHLIRPGWIILPVNQRAMEHMSEHMGWRVPTSFNLDPINSPAALIHWRCLTVLAHMLTKSAMEDLRRTFGLPLSVSSVVPDKVTQDEEALSEDDITNMKPVVFAFDSHFHLDRLTRRLNLPRDVSVKDIMQRMPVEDMEDYVVDVSGGIAVYCDPETYPSGEELVELVTNGCRAVVGVHPKKTISESGFRQLEGLLRSSAVVGLGEIGLDHSVLPHDSWYRQEQQLKKLLPLLNPDQVLVLHLRGAEGDSTGLEVYMRCLDLLINLLPLYQKIQLHCFSGNTEVVKSWLETFPNTHFSFSGLVLHFNGDQREALRQVPEAHLLLETDAPYFPLVREHSCSAPHLLDRVAREVANIKGGLTTEEVLELAETNARRFFHC